MLNKNYDFFEQHDSKMKWGFSINKILLKLNLSPVAIKYLDSLVSLILNLFDELVVNWSFVHTGYY